MVKAYGCIDIIIKSSALENYPGGARAVGKNEKVQSGHYDSELICLRLGMSPWDAENTARYLSQKYHFSLPRGNSANDSDSVVVEMGYPTTECNWIEVIGNGALQLKSEIKEWDANKWLEEFRTASMNMDTHKVRAAVYKYTQEVSEKGEYTIDGKTVKIEDPDKSILYDKEIVLDNNLSKNQNRVDIKVINDDCLAVARIFKDDNPLVLNMANRQTPGGGVVGGAGAQEECLFRSSNYYKSLYRESYPMDRDFGGIYTSNVTVFRDLESKGYPLLEEPFKTSFVAVAAIRNPELTANGHLTKAMEVGARNKIKTILNIAVLHGHRTLILSALGCGAFHNPPEDIARIFDECLQEEPYGHFFEKVIFAIKSDHNDKLNTNYKAFEKVFSN